MHPENELLWPDLVRCYDHTLPTHAENLALDEALLDRVEADPAEACLRFWQPITLCVVLGRSNNVNTEVALDRCSADGVPVLRRMTGGGTVLIGPGCLCYSLVLPISESHRSLGIATVTKELMLRSAAGLSSVLPGVMVCGTSDLAWHQFKFSGNAQRWLRQSFIHHGTLLFDFELALLDRYLLHPTREPDYRRAREHSDFVMNMKIPPADLQHSMQLAWQATNAECPAAALNAASRITNARYLDRDWTILP